MVQFWRYFLEFEPFFYFVLSALGIILLFFTADSDMAGAEYDKKIKVLLIQFVMFHTR